MNFLLQEKKLMFTSASILFLSILSGILLQNFLLRGMFETIELDSTKLDHWWFYFSSNSLTCLLIITGIFIYATPTILLLVFNGIMIGITVVVSTDQGASIGQIIWALLPHGIFEVPAIIIAGMIGLKGFMFYHKEKDKMYYIKLIKSIGFVFLLLLLASFIEAYISVHI
ncbi:stage II sporulation protein M [Peribacillus simplex]